MIENFIIAVKNAEKDIWYLTKNYMIENHISSIEEVLNRILYSKLPFKKLACVKILSVTGGMSPKTEEDLQEILKQEAVLNEINISFNPKRYQDIREETQLTLSGPPDEYTGFWIKNHFEEVAA